MRLIGLAVVLTLGLTLAPLYAEGQQPEKVYRIGYLSPAPGPNPIDQAFERSLKELGYVEGQNLRLERRYTGGRSDQMPGAAAELVRLSPDVIVVWSSAGTAAVRGATSTIPVIFLAGGAAGQGASATNLTRPSGNVTGVTFYATRNLTPKHLEILSEVMPKLTRASLLTTPAEDPDAGYEEQVAAAQSLGIRLSIVVVRGPDDLKGAFATLEKGKAAGTHRRT